MADKTLLLPTNGSWAQGRNWVVCVALQQFLSFLRIIWRREHFDVRLLPQLMGHLETVGMAICCATSAEMNGYGLTAASYTLH